MSWECPTCGAQNSCWGTSIYRMPMGRAPRDVALEAAAQGLVNALAALSEHPPDIKPAITYFEASPTKDPECFKRWNDLNAYVVLVKRVLESNRNGSQQETGTDPCAKT